MDLPQKRYILENLGRKPIQQIARDLGLKERKVRKFLLMKRKEQASAPAVAESGNFCFRKNAKFLVTVLCLFTAIGFLIYSNALSAAFVLDDFSNIVFVAKQAGFSPGHFLSGDPLRFFTNATFVINYCLGGLNPSGYHLVNILIHICASYSVFLLILVLFETPRLRYPCFYGQTKFCAFFSAVLFLCHPIQTQAVTYVVQRSTSLAALFYFSALTFYILAAKTQRKSIYWTAFIFSLAAMFTKQNAITLPAAVIFVEFFLFPKSQDESFRRKVKRCLPFLALMLLPLLVMMIHLSQWNPAKAVQVAANSEDSPWTYFLTQLRVIPYYLRLIVWPDALSLYHGFKKSGSFWEMKTFLSFLFLLTLLLSGIFMKRKNPLLTFCVIWFFLTLSVESSFIPIIHVVFEHRMYLPMFGICLAFSSILLRLIRNRRVAIGIFFVMITALSVRTYLRNKDWQTEETIWRDASKKYQPGVNQTLRFDPNEKMLIFNRTEDKPFSEWTEKAAQ